MPLSEGWRDQYQRMLRSRDRLAEAAGPSSIGSDEARDRLYHFFQDAFHLKDWLIHDLGLSESDANDMEDHITATDALARCADISNGTKHLKLKRPRIPGKPAQLGSQSVSVSMPTIAVGVTIGGSPPKPKKPAEVATAEHQWTVDFDGQQLDAVALADEVIAEWESWLKAKGHL